MKNITFNADESLINAAQERAREEGTTLEAQFRLWLAEYSKGRDLLEAYDETTRDLRGRLVVGRKLTREGINTR